MFTFALAVTLISYAYALTSSEIENCVTSHNALRALHEGTPPLQWDDDLSAKAQRYANTLLRKHQGRTRTQLIHERPANGLGENLYWRDSQKKASCARAALNWYNEIRYYSYQTGKTTNRAKMVGHFTQLVWKSTTKFGVGIATGKSRRFADYGNVETFIVAKYSPQGNFHYIGHYLQSYTENVRPRIRGSITPRLSELEQGGRGSACANRVNSDWCSFQIKQNVYKCSTRYFQQNCARSCGKC